MQLHRNMLVDDVMRNWPATIRCFLAMRMKCVGCPFATFHTIADACLEHAVSESEFIQSLEATIATIEIKPSALREEPAGAGRG